MAALLGVAFLLFRSISAVPPAVDFSQSTRSLEAFDFVEVTAQVFAPHPSNPFTDGSIRGTFKTAAGNKQWNVEGFCDSEDGSVYRLRFMPLAPGDYTYSVEYRQGWSKKTSSGTFYVRNGHRRGLVRIDPQNHWHFVWEGTGEHYFFNGTTAYWLMGWRDEQVINPALSGCIN
jgi:Domain of unknown function (DUF5060)